MELLLVPPVSIGGMALISEMSWRESLTDRGRIIVPVALGTAVWAVWAVIGIIVAAVVR